MKHKNTKTSSSTLLQCCMCGDSGITRELFRCKLCHFRSQHRYCSNLYPKSESYKVCNWCLNQKEDSLNSSASCKSGNTKNSKLQKPVKNGIKKSMSEEKLSPRKKRKRIMTNACAEEKLRRTKPEEMSKNGIITRHVFRNKVRRYKLLDEVSS
ncbi:hypothetical protein like AT3G60520 [Hibiscus trionum]|uniref:PHD-type zinc finger plants domain-containing protein n=1 Tax=Hibiscus trionum TaxID=183268 RepID=A0A9W7I8S8_HIBTR|nr:hypothetical protein like AT3G60520 [Hibiscus trionum]